MAKFHNHHPSSNTGSLNPTPASVSRLQEQAAQLISNSVAPSTVKKYTQCYSYFLQFCKNMNMPPLPLQEQTLTLFATHLSNSMSHTNIVAHIAGIKFSSEVRGYDLDITPYNRLYRLLRGIKRTQGSKFKKPPRIPITPSLLMNLGTNL